MSEWISVEDRLPKKADWYLVSWQSVNPKARWNPDVKETWVDPVNAEDDEYDIFLYPYKFHRILIRKPTHWRTKPKPPQEDA